MNKSFIGRLLSIFLLLGALNGLWAGEELKASPEAIEAHAPTAALMAKDNPLLMTELPEMSNLFDNIWKSTGLYSFLFFSDQDFKNAYINRLKEMDAKSKHYTAHAIQSVQKQEGLMPQALGRFLMILVGMLVLWAGISKGFEPLLLVPIGFGCMLANIPQAGIAEPGGILYYVFNVGIDTGVFPLIIFMGVGAMTDFGPLIANPKTVLLGGAAQIGIFATLIGALALSKYTNFVHFSLADASAIGIIGGADGPTAIYLSSKLSKDLMGSIAVAAYSYMALVPLIQPPIMRALTTPEERKIKMEQLRYVSKREKILFPIIVLVLCLLLLPSAAPLIGFFTFGNLMKESGMVDRLADTAQNALINIVTIFLGLGVGSKLSADKFLTGETLGILILGIIAFSMGTGSGVLMAKFMNLFAKKKVNPLIGSAGVSAVPMAARVSQVEGAKADPSNFLLMHAMGPNVAGVIGSAVAAGVLLAVFGQS